MKLATITSQQFFTNDNDYEIVLSTGLDYYTFFVKQGNSVVKTIRTSKLNPVLEGYQECYDWIAAQVEI